MWRQRSRSELKRYVSAFFFTYLSKVSAVIINKTLCHSCILGIDTGTIGQLSFEKKLTIRLKVHSKIII